MTDAVMERTFFVGVYPGIDEAAHGLHGRCLPALHGRRARGGRRRPAGLQPGTAEASDGRRPQDRVHCRGGDRPRRARLHRRAHAGAPVPRFKPGQFLHLALDAYQPGGFWPESRVFSIASSPRERDRLAITYAVKGAFTARMERELAEGRGVWVKLPYGEFVIDQSRDAVLFAGGTGVTAFTAFLQSLETGRAPRVLLFYGARTPDLFVYGSPGRGVRRRGPVVRLHPRRGGVGRSAHVDAAWPAIEPPGRPDLLLEWPAGDARRAHRPAS